MKSQALFDLGSQTRDC